MKKIIISICIVFTTLLSFTSCCDLYGETIYSNGISYEYSYLDRPVFFLNGSYFWYVFVNDSWVYRPIPREYWGEIYHFDRPRMFYPNRPNINRGRFEGNVTHPNNSQRNINRPTIPQIRPQGQFQSSTRITGRPQGNTPLNGRILRQGNNTPSRGTFQQGGPRGMSGRR